MTALFLPLFLFFASRIAWEDYTSRRIRLVDFLIVISVILWWKNPAWKESIVCCAFFLMIYGLQYRLKKRWIATADLFLVCATPLLIAVSMIPLFFICLGSSLCLYHYATKEKHAPFVTFYMFCFLGFSLYAFYLPTHFG